MIKIFVLVIAVFIFFVPATLMCDEHHEHHEHGDHEHGHDVSINIPTKLSIKQFKNILKKINQEDKVFIGSVYTFIKDRNIYSMHKDMTKDNRDRLNKILRDTRHKSARSSLWTYLISWKYLLTLIFVLVGVFLLWKYKITTTIRTIWLFFAFVVFGMLILVGLPLAFYPSPMCAITKPFSYGLKSHFLTAAIVMFVLTVLFNKSFCGKVCPGGALQEIIYNLSPFKKKKISFKVSNWVRVVLFLVFVLIFYVANTSIYEYVNLFDMFHWSFAAPVMVLVNFFIFLALVIVTSAINYRPFCYFICPVGLFSWLLEQLSITRINLDKSKCTECKLCEKKSPCIAITNILANDTFRADCHLCGKCIEVCPEEALKYGLRRTGS